MERGETVAAPATMRDLPMGNQQPDDSTPQPPVLYAQRERVDAKEKAMEIAMASLRVITGLVDTVSTPSSEPDLSTWKCLARSVAEDCEAFRFLVGVSGDTGAGKSSLLNALISEKADVAPSSQNGACTAAVCCFLHSGSGHISEQTYTANIHLKSKETVDQELAAFFYEYNEFEDRVRLAGGEDSITYGERERLNDQINVIRAWSGLSKQQLEDLGVNRLVPKITSTCSDRDDLFDLEDHQRGKLVRVSSPDAGKFLQSIKPYVGSSGKNTGLIRWPLVEKVEILIHADFLRGGIVLVDLPGEMDALDTRTQIARAYYNKLDSLMVVTPGDRAFDNKTTMETIRDDQIMDMEGDGLFRDNGLCVVVSKVDQMDWRNFVETEYSAEDISPDFEKLYQSLRAKESEKTALEHGIVDLETGGGRKDGELGCLLDLKNKLAEEIEHLDSICLGQCIDARNKDIHTAFEDYFDRIRNSARGQKAAKVSTDLRVISVSSKAHRMRARGKYQAAFDEEGSTGINTLKDWIIESSLQKREEHADTILQRCQVLFDAIEDWTTEESHARVVLPRTDHKEIRRILDKERVRLRASLQGMVRKYGRRVDTFLSEASLGKSENANGDFAQSFVPHVDAYQKDRSGTLHWTTYAACIRRRGGAFRTSDRPRKTHCWQARTYGLLWKGHAHKWGHAYGQALEEATDNLGTRLQKRIGGHIERTTQAEDLPVGFRNALRSCAYRIENIFTGYRFRIKTAVRKHRETARVIKQGSRDLLASNMRAAYAAADCIAGKRKLKRQVATMRRFAEEMKHTIFSTVSRQVDDKLKEERASLRKRLRTETTKVVGEICKIEQKVCTSCGRPPQRQARTINEHEIRDLVSRQIHDWRQYWSHMRAQFPRVEVILDADSTSTGEESDENGSTGIRGAKATKKRAKKAVEAGPGKKSKRQQVKTDPENEDTE